MANILVAAVPKPREILERILDAHDLACADTLARAKRLLRTQRVELIVCTILFDESRMIDFLRLVKAKAEWRRIPFLCSRVKIQPIGDPVALEAVEITCRATGAEAFLDIATFENNSEQRMRTEMEKFLV